MGYSTSSRLCLSLIVLFGTLYDVDVVKRQGIYMTNFRFFSLFRDVCYHVCHLTGPGQHLNPRVHVLFYVAIFCKIFDGFFSCIFLFICFFWCFRFCLQQENKIT